MKTNENAENGMKQPERKAENQPTNEMKQKFVEMEGNAPNQSAGAMGENASEKPAGAMGESGEGKPLNSSDKLKALIDQLLAQEGEKLRIEITYIENMTGDCIKTPDPEVRHRKELTDELEELSRLSRDEVKLFLRFRNLLHVRACIAYVRLAQSVDDLPSLMMAFCKRYNITTNTNNFWGRELIQALHPFCTNIKSGFLPEKIQRHFRNLDESDASSSTSLPE